MQLINALPKGCDVFAGFRRHQLARTHMALAASLQGKRALDLPPTVVVTAAFWIGAQLMPRIRVLTRDELHRRVRINVSENFRGLFDGNYN